MPKLLICFAIIVIILAACSSAAAPSPTPAPTIPSTVSTAPATKVAACPQIVKTALDAVAGRCNAIGANQICYGNQQIDATLANTSAVFKAPGDQVKINDLKSLHTGKFDEKAGTWGIAIMRAAVNLPDSAAGQQVTFLMYGDTTIDSFSADMKTLSFRTGIGEGGCNEVPPSSLTVQVPKGQHINFTVNGVDITLGSTALMQAVPDQEIAVNILEGQGQVQAQGVTQQVSAGNRVRVPLKGLVASGAPSKQEPIPLQQIGNPPTTLLSQPITLPQIQSAIAAASTQTPAANTSSTAAPTVNITPQASVTPLLTWTPGPTLVPGVAGGQNRIAYAANQNGHWEIYVMQANGSNPVRLTNGTSDSRAPAWSPDGSHIVYTAFNGHTFQLYTMGDDGKNAAPLTQPDGSAGHPSWSPDSRTITYDFLINNNRDIRLIDTGGGNARALASNPADDSSPAWSPDGKRIAFVSLRDGNKEIYAVDADGSNLGRLTNNPSFDVLPAWSPDSKRIAFVSSRSGNDEIYVMDADGKNTTRLTSNPGIDTAPVWSPDGSQIAFVSDRGGTRAIYVMTVNGTTPGDPRRLTDATFDSDDPAWQR